MADNYDQSAGQALDADESQEESQAQAASRDPEDILQEARDRFALAEKAETDIRTEFVEDLKFRAGEQWPDKVQQDRAQDGRPCLVINRLPTLIHQVTNDQRQNRPAIKVHPIDSAATEETAKVIQGLIRHIEYNSNADVAYDTALESAVSGGFGYFRIITGFVAPDSFDQEIYIKRVRDPLSVYFDPFAQEPDGSDASWAFIVDELSKSEFKAKYPNAKASDAQFDWASGRDSYPSWFSNEGLKVAEYFYRETEPDTVHLLSTGITVRGGDLEQHLLQAAQTGLKISVVKSRETQIPVIKWCKIAGNEILESTDWPGSYIPIIPVYGAEIVVEGKRILEGLVRNAKDPQRMLNYWKSAETEAIALAPRAPFIGAEGQFEGHEAEWATANRRNHAYLEYKPTTIAGQMAPPPQRNSVEPAVQAITMASQGAKEDLQDTTGIYPAGVGAQSNEVSGVAIQKRATQVQTANFHFVDNLTRSLKHAGRILVDLIPKIYDTPRAARIIGDDGVQKIVTVNGQTKDEKGQPILYSLDSGRYDVTVDVGPSFASKRQEAAASMIDFSRAAPQVAQLAADLIVKNMDWPGAQELSDRLRKALPPGLADDGKQQPLPPQVQAQMSQMGQMIDALQKELSEATKVIETKSMELQHKERIELMKQQFDVAKLEAELGSKESLALLAHQVQEISGRLKLLGMNQPIEAPSNFDPMQADGGNYPGIGHIGGSANIPGGETPAMPTGGRSPGQIPGA